MKETTRNMLQTQLTVAGNMQISLAPPRGVDRVVGWYQRVRATRGPHVLMALLALAGEIAIANQALIPSVTPDPDGGSPLRLLLPYSAMVLGFLSSYWGLWKPVDLDFDAPYSPRRAALAERKRLIISLAPTVTGGVGLLLPVLANPAAGLLTVLFGFVMLFTLEIVGSHFGLRPANLRGLRWSIGAGSALVLTNVATVMLLGFSLFF